MATWEMVLVGIIAIAVTMWFLPGIRGQLNQQKEKADQPKDWRGLILPLVFVVLFVLLLISIV